MLIAINELSLCPQYESWMNYMNKETDSEMAPNHLQNTKAKYSLLASELWCPQHTFISFSATSNVLAWLLEFSQVSLVSKVSLSTISHQVGAGKSGTRLQKAYIKENNTNPNIELCSTPQEKRKQDNVDWIFWWTKVCCLCTFHWLFNEIFNTDIKYQCICDLSFFYLWT